MTAQHDLDALDAVVDEAIGQAAQSAKVFSCLRGDQART